MIRVYLCKIKYPNFPDGNTPGPPRRERAILPHLSQHMGANTPGQDTISSARPPMLNIVTQKVHEKPKKTKIRTSEG